MPCPCKRAKAKYLVTSYDFITKYLVHGISRPLVERSYGTKYYGTSTFAHHFEALLRDKFHVIYNVKDLVNSYQFITKYLVHGISRPLVERSYGTKYYGTSTFAHHFEALLRD